MRQFRDTAGNMLWWIGVVEDRNDPEQVGRVRVRIFGDHSDDRNAIPTTSLPWAQVMMPATSGSLGGIGDSPTGIVHGSWVVGFYLDGESKQQPLVMGTIPGITAPADPARGFSDPNGIHPVRANEPDTPYMAMPSTYREHASFITRTDLRVDDVDMAVPPNVSSVAVAEPDTYYERQTWSMPQVQSGIPPTYPYNNVRETEGGHVFEVDNTPGNERIVEYHKSGTHYEIQSDGAKTETIVGNNYKVVLENDNIYIVGNANLTIDGDLRTYVKGNYHLEVNGNKTELIRGIRQAKVGKNDQLEVLQSSSANVKDDLIQRIGKNETRVIGLSRNVTVGTDDDLQVTGDYSRIVMGKTDAYSHGNFQHVTNAALNVTAKGDITVESKANMTENIEGNVTETFGGNQVTTASTIDINANRIDLN